MAYYWLIVAFILGSAIGSFLNVCIARLPLEKSILWPGSRCGSCLQAIRWYDNLPLFSYLWLRGKCRKCGAGFSSRYFWIELASGLGVAGLFYAEVMRNIHDWPVASTQRLGIAFGAYPWQWWVVWLVHVILFSFLLVASVCDLDGREIPISLTMTGTIVGLVVSVLLPWPWPRTPDQALPQPRQLNIPGLEVHFSEEHPKEGVEWQFPDRGLKEGLYPWPVWGPLHDWLQPGSWQLGLATGLAGMLAGTFLLRAVAFLFKRGLGREALGLGDADLMMMAGAFLGWQPVVVAFFVSALPALVFGLIRLIAKRDNELPYGPSLAAAVVVVWLCWRWIGPGVQVLFFWGEMLVALALVGAIFMLFSSYAIRVIRGGRPGVGANGT